MGRREALMGMPGASRYQRASLYTEGPVGGPSLPWRTYLALFFNLFPRFVVPCISESESDSATRRPSQPRAYADTRECSYRWLVGLPSSS